MQLFLAFMGITVLTVLAVAGILAGGTTASMIAALGLAVVGTVLIIGFTIAYLGPDGYN